MGGSHLSLQQDQSAFGVKILSNIIKQILIMFVANGSIPNPDEKLCKFLLTKENKLDFQQDYKVYILHNLQIPISFFLAINKLLLLFYDSRRNYNYIT